MSVPDDMTDERWTVEAGEIAPGWHPGRVHIGGGQNDAGPAFGWVKGSFGIFEGNSKTALGRLELSSLTHLKSGFRVGLFAEPSTAAMAAELAERVGDWSEIKEDGTFNPRWRKRARQMYALWNDAGIMCGPIVTETGTPVWCAPEPVKKQN